MRVTYWQPALFSGVMDNSGAANSNRPGRLPSSGSGTPRGRSARKRPTLGAASSPNRSDDGSGAQMPRTGGGDRCPNVDGQPDEDGPDDDFNPATFLSTLAASDQPMLNQPMRVS